MDMFTAFKNGAAALSSATYEYRAIHEQHGLSKSEWATLTQAEPWTPDQRRMVKSILQECLQISATIAGLPPTPLPAQYVAATIANLVQPSNRLVAAQRAPECFDAIAASGLTQEVEIRPVKPETMFALVIAYSADVDREPPMRVDAEMPASDATK